MPRSRSSPSTTARSSSQAAERRSATTPAAAAWRRRDPLPRPRQAADGASGSPHVAGPPLTRDRRGQIDRRRAGRDPDHDVAVLVRRCLLATVREHGRWATPRLPAEALVETLRTGAQRAHLVAAVDECAHLAHERRSMALALQSWRSGYGFHVAGTDRDAAHMERPVHDRAVADYAAVQLDHEMTATERMLPVVLGESAVLVVRECGPKELANRLDLSLR